MAGVALSQIGNVSPNLGTIYIVDSFMVVVFGGVGSLFGTLAGAMTLGIVNKLLEPFAGAVLGKIVVLVAIILFIQKRPRGLFALKGRAAEELSDDPRRQPVHAARLDRASSPSAPCSSSACRCSTRCRRARRCSCRTIWCRCSANTPATRSSRWRSISSGAMPAS